VPGAPYPEMIALDAGSQFGRVLSTVREDHELSVGFRLVAFLIEGSLAHGGRRQDLASLLETCAVGFAGGVSKDCFATVIRGTTRADAWHGVFVGVEARNVIHPASDLLLGRPVILAAREFAGVGY